jgi:hypothetical protein
MSETLRYLLLTALNRIRQARTVGALVYVAVQLARVGFRHGATCHQSLHQRVRALVVRHRA